MDVSYLPAKRILWVIILSAVGLFFLRRIQSSRHNLDVKDGSKALNNREVHTSLDLSPPVDTNGANPPVNEKAAAAPPEEPTVIPPPDNANALPNFYIHNGDVSVYQESVSAFVHVARSGGTTMKMCFNKTALYYGNQTPKLLDRENRRQIKTLFKNAKLTSKAYRLYAGEYAFGICEDIPDRTCSYIIILRNPYERIVSAYYDCREKVGASGYPLDCHNTEIQDWVMAVQSMSMEYIFTHFNCVPIIDKENWFIPRYECDYKLPHMNTYPVFSTNGDLVQYVLDNLDKTFALIGLTEEYIMTLQLLQNAFNIPFYEECKDLVENKGTFTDTNAKEQAKQTLMSNPQIQEALSADLKLYEKAKELFEIQKQKLAAMFS